MQLSDVQAQMHAFVGDRGWYGAGSPKPQTPANLAMSLAIEAGELLECFQWGPPAEGDDRVADELADVVLYAAQLANVAGVDLAEAVGGKLARNATREWVG